MHAAGRIRILFAIDGLLRGGTELQLAGLIGRLDRQRYEPCLLTIRQSDPDLLPVDCRHLQWQVPSLISIGGARALWRLARFLRRERIDVVQTYFQDSTLLVAAAARLAGVPVRIACFRDLGFWSTRMQALCLRFAYRQMTHFIANAAIVREHFIARFAVPRDRIRVIRNGVDAASLRYVAHGRDVHHIGIVGNMTRGVKRTDLFVRAAAIVAARYPGIRWHIIGDGHLRGRLEDLASELGVLDSIEFAGRIEDVPGYLERLQIGVLCSDSEGLSNAVIEYMFKGTAVVATAVGGNPELVSDGTTGLLVPPGDAEALAAAILRLIENPVLRERVVHAARESVEAAFSWQRCLTEHEEIYRKVLT